MTAGDRREALRQFFADTNRPSSATAPEQRGGRGETTKAAQVVHSILRLISQARQPSPAAPPYDYGSSSGTYPETELAGRRPGLQLAPTRGRGRYASQGSTGSGTVARISGRSNYRVAVSRLPAADSSW